MNAKWRSGLRTGRFSSCARRRTMGRSSDALRGQSVRIGGGSECARVAETSAGTSHAEMARWLGARQTLPVQVRHTPFDKKTSKKSWDWMSSRFGGRSALEAMASRTENVANPKEACLPHSVGTTKIGRCYCANFA